MEIKQKKVLIIGAKGMLGQELVKVFDNGQYEIVAWDVADIDVSSQTQVNQKVGALRPKIIINAAAYNAVDKAEEPAESVLAQKINGEAPGFLAEVAKKLGAVLVHFSSDYVFAGDRQAGYKEDDVPFPISKYGQSKLAGEKAIQKVGGNFYIIRLQKLFGQPAQSPGAKKSFFETMLNLAQDKKEFNMVDEELANFTYAPDLAGRVRYLIEKKMPFGVYHITNEGRPVTWFGAAKILFEMTGQKAKLNLVSADELPRPARRPKYAVLLNTKLPPLRPWDEALREFLKNKTD